MEKLKIIGMFLVYLVILIPFSYSVKAQDTTPPNISNVTVIGITATTATITWDTNEDATSKVYYGITSAYGNEKSLPGLSLFHYVTLTGLTDGVLYYYKIESCDIDNNCNNHEGTFAAGSDVVPPFIELEIPQYYNKNTLHLSGKTEPYSEIKIYLNNIYKGFIGSATTGAQGIIDFDLTGLQIGANTIRINAKDSSDNVNEETYTVNIDTSPPDYQINAIPDTASKQKITITGSVSEPVNISFYVIENYDKTAPVKVTGLKEEDVEKNSLSFSWDANKESDLDFYAIYRNSFRITTYGDNQFTDLNLNTDTSYTYQVSAVDKSCNEGEKSDELTLKTLSGGNIISVSTENVPLPCETKNPVATVNTANTFSQEINLAEGDNLIRIVITDLAGNSVSEEKTVLFDSKPPKIEHTNLEDLSPSYIRDVTVTGKVDEPSTIYVYVNVEDIPKIDRDTPIEEVFRISDEKSTYKGSTDADGYFSIGIELQREAYLAFGDNKLKGEVANSWVNTITIVAVDRIGLTDTYGPKDIEYTLCGHGSDWDINLDPLDRDVLIPRLILEGVEQFGLYYTLKWQGPGDVETWAVNNIRLDTRQLSREEQDKLDEEWISGSPDTHPSSDWTAAYSLIKIKAYPEPAGSTTLEKENNISDHRKGECILKDHGCIKLPLMLEIDYSYTDPYNNKPVSKTQRQCWDTEIAIDRRAPSDKIPKEFLKASIKVLNDTIKVIDKLVKPVQNAYKYTFYGCAISWGVYIAAKALEFGSCFGVGGIPFVGYKTCDPNDPEDGENCKQCLEQRAKSEQVWVVLKWLCDRIMCPSAPTIQKYINDMKGDNVVNSHCDDQDLSEIDFEVSQEEYDKCNKFHEDYSKVEVRDVKDKDWGAPDEECCEAEYKKEWDSASLFLNELEESYCLTLTDYTKNQAETGDEATPQISCGGVKALTRIARGICVGETNEPELIKINDKYYAVLQEDGMRKAYEAETIEKGKLEEYGNEYKIGSMETFVKKKGVKELLTENDCYKGGTAKAGAELWSYDDRENPKRSKVPEEVWNLICIKSGDYVVDPTSDIFSAFQSVCLSAMREYLNHWRNILQLTKNCFETILYTGDGSAGVCKQFLSIYLCDLLYMGIKCIMQKASKGVGNKTEKGIAGFLSYLSQSGGEVQNRISDRYGKSNIYKALFVERKLIHSLCLFAFTGDFDLDIEGLIETEAKVPIKPTCVITGTRRYITRDPEQYGMATFMYNIGAFVLAGADDTSFEVQLVCSADNRCDTNDFDNGRCDCFLYEKGEQMFRIAAGELNQGESYNNEIYESIKKPFRYDRARIRVSYVNNQGDRVDEICGEVNLQTAGGKPPLGCGFDLLSMEYRCEFKWGQHGVAYFEEDPKPNKKEYFSGDKFYLNGNIIKESVSSDPKDQEKMFFVIRLKRNNIDIYEKSIELLQDKTYELNKDFWSITFVNEKTTDDKKLYPFAEDSEIAELKYEVSLHYDDGSGKPMTQSIYYNNKPQIYTSEEFIVHKQAITDRCTEVPSQTPINKVCRCGEENRCGDVPNKHYCCNKENPYCKITGEPCNKEGPHISVVDKDIIIKYGNLEGDKSQIGDHSTSGKVVLHVKKGAEVVFMAKDISDQDPGVYMISLTIGNDEDQYKKTYESDDPSKYKKVEDYSANIQTSQLKIASYDINITAIDRDGAKSNIFSGVTLSVESP